jgi:DnaJ-domain-containing protein 1
MSDPRRTRSTELRLPDHDQPPRRLCDWPGCDCLGEFRAPKGRERLREFLHFCLEHVREYNRSWDFFSGMSQAEIEAYLREDVTWHRPSWPFGTARPRFNPAWRWQDPLGEFMNGGGTNGTHGASEWDRRRAPLGKTDKMLQVMDLAPGATRADLKARYKQLVKKHHPDLHGGDKKAEERLKVINEAYTYLLDSEQFA